MFIDELFEKYLIEEGMTYGDAIQKVCEEKLSDADSQNFESVKRIENGYLLYCTRHPEADKQMFRKYVCVYSPKLYQALGWDRLQRV